MSAEFSVESLTSLIETKLIDLKDKLVVIIKEALLSQFEALKQEFTATTDFIMAQQKSLEQEISNKSKIIKTLQEENIKIKSDLSGMRNRIMTTEKLSRSCNLEIHGIPEKKNENVMTIYKTLCDLVSHTYSEYDVKACRRVAKFSKTSSHPRTILVTLSSPRARDEIISSVLRLNKSKDYLTSEDFGFNKETQKNRVYVSENLCPEIKELLFETKKVAKERNYQFTWVKFGQIYVRKNVESQVILIKNQECLVKLI
ncbi:hypothetical protein JYU34_009232 [Plutella xylostella]|uniref:FP protein C-terminal domain-containing protein n=1 Tax=Plutella xylostella TaxID=51655 RepID=A0ABQ7QJG8_PLUXY|nr:hypothetical protein JYU34_018601 [Plutella xylostella]KAG7301960.1 hypothetical protein JYU34_013404 [Plutella xylostella]KAG7305195.1 hypothetical protein JYU34_009232 [Plutella xylostella]